jgi:hypothetical protein
MADAPDTDDSLEAELRSFAPAAPSREFFDRVGRELDRPALPSRPVRLRPWVAGAAAALAACFVVAAVLWRGHTSVEFTPTPIASTVPSWPVTDAGDDRPALATYRRALFGSAGALDDLLDRHAARLLPGAGGSAGGARVTASSELGILH